MYYKNPVYRISYFFIVAILLIASILCVLPIIHIFMVSLSGRSAANANLVTLWPIDFTLTNYEKTLGNPAFYRSFMISVARTVVGTAFSMLITVLTAYPLSMAKSVFRSRNFYLWFFVFIMIFNGGLVPYYILIQKIGLLDSFWMYIIPGALNVWNVILMMNFFRNLPKELEEAALVDGAHFFDILFRIYIPTSMPGIATLSLFNIVGQWNDWFTGMLYMNSPDKWPLSTLLQTIVVAIDFNKLGMTPSDLENLSQRGVKSAQIFITMLPILVVYPFLQKYFVKGIVLGAVKE